MFQNTSKHSKVVQKVHTKLRLQIFCSFWYQRFFFSYLFTKIISLTSSSDGIFEELFFEIKSQCQLLSAMQQVTRNSIRIYSQLTGIAGKENLLIKVRNWIIFRLLSFGTVSIFIFRYQHGLWGLSSGHFSFAFVASRKLSALASIEFNKLQFGIVRKISPTDQGPLLLVDAPSDTSSEFKKPLTVKVGISCNWLEFEFLESTWLCDLLT